MMLNVNNLVLGTAQLGMDYGIANLAGKPSKAKALNLLSLAWKYGIRHFDTAPVYNTEDLLGDFIRAHGVQDTVKVLTKIPRMHSVKRYQDFINTTLNKSLERIDCPIDVLFFHHADDSVLISKDPIFFDNLLKTTSISFIGVSVYQPEEITRLSTSKLELVYQYPLNVADRRFENFTFPTEKHYARSIFLQGLLVSPNDIRDSAPARLVEFQNSYRAFLKKRKIKPIEFSLAYILSKRPSGQFIVGLESEQQLRNLLNVDITQQIIDYATTMFDRPEFNLLIQDPRFWKQTV